VKDLPPKTVSVDKARGGQRVYAGKTYQILSAGGDKE
jgi:hypothetical protein